MDQILFVLIDSLVSVVPLIFVYDFMKIYKNAYTYVYNAFSLWLSFLTMKVLLKKDSNLCKALN
ncbi:MAG: hypothetical protein K0R16_867 [Nitrososphaeraceae archaeon]|jgi:hypothetical protein|nr:hypothetical protein [Nitrososphaeraceae archaeon]MDF2767637.1 hypothetical protein [Nitrososphaeraceae archaeon]